MIDSLFNLLFRCAHRRTTFPLTPLDRTEVVQKKEAYVVCLDCGKQFTYDWKKMRVGKPVDSASLVVEQPVHRIKRPSRFRYVLWASTVPAVWLIRKAIKSRKRREDSGRRDQRTIERSDS